MKISYRRNKQENRMKVSRITSFYISVNREISPIFSTFTSGRGIKYHILSCIGSIDKLRRGDIDMIIN